MKSLKLAPSASGIVVNVGKKRVPPMYDAG
jgi:hypothetical protein